MGETPPPTEASPPVQPAVADVENPQWQSSFPAPPGISERSPFIKYDSKPLGGTMEPVEWDFSALKPEPAFLSPALESSSAPPPESPVHPPIKWEDSPAGPEPEHLSRDAPALGETTESPAEATAESGEQKIVRDSSGQQWLDLGVDASGMHKISSLDRNHIRNLSEETFQQFTPAEAEPPPDPEKQAMKDEIEKLTAKVGQLENRINELLVRLGEQPSTGQEAQKPTDTQPEESGRIFSWVTGTYEPVKVINKGSRNGESFVTVLREGHDKPVTVFADEYEYWQTQALKMEAAPRNKDQARRHFSEGFQSVRSKLSEMRSKTKETLQPTVDDIKLKAGYVSGYAKLASQVAGEKIDEKTKAYKKRLIGRAAGYAAVFSVWIFGRSEVAPQPDTNNSGQKVESPPVVTV